ncbi:potassium channel subfamily K member 2-like [Rhincodon typus]|uniref:potassium channel subfamily K member 2-like n=1 Tax=Rhincodon typus TaxID=259920 RepID=UPI00202E3DBE|nr:potassium channel subfamily K member 2-like [Rhincodon typus]
MDERNRLSSRRCALLFLGYFMYLLIGAVVFQALELKEEHKLKTKIWKEKLQFLENCSCLSREVLETFMEAVTEAVKHGVNPIGNDSKSSHSNWDISSSFFFAAAVVSTIEGAIKCQLLKQPEQLQQSDRALAADQLAEVQKNCQYKVCVSSSMHFKQVDSVRRLRNGEVSFRFLAAIFRQEVCKRHPKVVVELHPCSKLIISMPTGVNPHIKYIKFYRAAMAIWILFGMAWLALLFNLLTTFMEDTEKKIAQIKNKKKEAKAKMNFRYDANANSSSADDSILSDSETGVQEGAQNSSDQEAFLQVESKTMASDPSQQETTSEPESLNTQSINQEIT